jgi:hypothetical protein
MKLTTGKFDTVKIASHGHLVLETNPSVRYHDNDSLAKIEGDLTMDQ